ncbi:MAG TPA: hypothetical protein VNH46_03020, partial [Gemmatimonadales bacterium]|nr:hypothetical protein [Gemmatimonadales bacterium]
MRRALVVTCLSLLPAVLAAQGRSYHVSGADVAIYNIVGEITVRAGTGPDVVVEVNPLGRDAGRLTVATGEIEGFQTLRVIYPDDRIVYDRLEDDGSTNLTIRDDGTWGSFDGRRERGRGDRRITVRGSGSGLEAAADLRISIPSGKRVGVYLGVGRLDAANVSGRIRLDGASADIHAEQLKGEITV